MGEAAGDCQYLYRMKGKKLKMEVMSCSKLWVGTEQFRERERGISESTWAVAPLTYVGTQYVLAKKVSCAYTFYPHCHPGSG